MNHISNDKIKWLFSNVKELNSYVEKHQPFLFENKKVEDYKIKGMVLKNGEVRNMEWKNMETKNSIFQNVTVMNSKFNDVDLSNSLLSNVIFKKVIFDKVYFDYSRLRNVKFENCEFLNGSFYKIKDSNILVTNSVFKNDYFEDAETELKFVDTKVDDGVFAGLKAKVFVVENGELKNADFLQAHLDELNLNGVYMDAVGCPKSIINTVYIKGGKLDIDIPAADIQKFSIYDANIENFSLGGAKIKELNISNCKETDQLGFFRGHIDKLTINNCYTNGLDLAKANINELIFSNVSTKESLSEHATINTCRLDNFQISGEIDLSEATIKNLYVHDFHYDPNAKVKTDGSNLEYNANGLRLKGVWPEVTPDRWLIFHCK